MVPRREKPTTIIIKEENKGRGLGILKNLRLVIVGGIIGFVPNQLLYTQNRITEEQISTKKEIFKENYDNYNRIRLFCLVNSVSTSTLYVESETVSERIEPKTGKVLSSKVLKHGNIKKITFLSFQGDKLHRSEFFSDLDQIKKSKFKLSPEVYGQLAILNGFLYNHPLPSKFEYEELARSEWQSDTIINQWHKILDNPILECMMNLDFESVLKK